MVIVALLYAILVLPRGRQLVTLKDAAEYIMKLPARPQPEWQSAA
jgi:hypothetical protein